MTTNGKGLQIADAFRQIGRKQLAPGLTSGFSRIGVKGKVWKLIHQGESYWFVQDDGHPLPYLDVVIIDANPNTSKLFYPPGTYTEDAANAPTCASTNGDVPDNGVPIKQSESCHTCIHNQWKPNRGGKDCQDHRRLAVLLLPYMKTKPHLDLRQVPPVFFKVPPASLKSFKSFSDVLDGEDAPFFGVITRITFDPTKQFQMNFSIKQALTAKEAPVVIPLVNSAQVRSLTGSISEVKQIEAKPPQLPPEPKEEESAFAPPQEAPTPAKRSPGRPRKPPEEAKAAKPAEEPAEEATPWEEPEDADLDKSMSDVLGKMMK